MVWILYFFIMVQAENQSQRLTRTIGKKQHIGLVASPNYLDYKFLSVSYCKKQNKNQTKPKQKTVCNFFFFLSFLIF